jgi:phosphoribosylamine--glycine ligase/phosphoribosylformylglycinamidine cyclo-ligase
VIFKVDDRFSATVVVAAGGYPDAYEKGTPMKVDAAAAGTNIFHAGTIIKDGQLQTSGGRVIAAQSSAETLQEAVNRAYVGVSFADSYLSPEPILDAFLLLCGMMTKIYKYRWAA